MSLREEHIELLSKLYEENYYLQIFESMIADMGLDQNQVDHIPEVDIPSFWNQFWIELPDSQAIHRKPFYDICDMAEKIFDDDEDHEDWTDEDLDGMIDDE